MMRIDAHHHLWKPERGDYHWMPKDVAVLNRAYAPRDLGSSLAACNIDKTILVQAAATVEETEYMLGLADGSDFIAGVVGWVDFEQPEHRAILDRLAGHPLFKGVRPMIQDLPDDDWMLRDDVQWAFAALSETGLTFDALGFPRHMKNFLTILTRYPDMRVVLDHCMKPQIRDHSANTFSAWADGIALLANETSAYCKFSALITEASEDWTTQSLRPYVEHILDCFGPDRVMWGSDWPVCRLRAEYEDWHAAAVDLTAELSDTDRAAVFGATASAFYQIPT